MSTEARIGWGGAFLLSSDATTANLFELSEIEGFGLPDDQHDDIEVTHLKSPNKRKEFISGLIDGGTVTVTITYAPGSATDAAIRDAKTKGDTRAVRFIIPDTDGTPDWQVDATAYVKGYSRGPLAVNAKITSTVTLRITGAQTEGVAA